MVKIRLMIVDDHPVVVEGMKILLTGEEDIEYLGSASDSEELFNFLGETVPDVLLLDLVLPGISGIEIAKILAEKYSMIKVVILSSVAEEESIVACLNAGARGYLTKDVPRDELIKAIKVISEGEEYLGESISRKVIISYFKRAKAGDMAVRPSVLELSDREKEVVGLISEGLTYKEVGEKLFISSRTVEAHRNNIMQKLELKTIADLIKYSIRQGITRL
jgi:DNA-binding NarL/FixJ family response regulator